MPSATFKELCDAAYYQAAYQIEADERPCTLPSRGDFLRFYFSAYEARQFNQNFAHLFPERAA